ncbi:MAG: ribosome-associated translation inhibitor RaiA [Victivallales bacterium]|nr:ribosome-associated translation inhibitor RaiA [Victivallales bacterium]
MQIIISGRHVVVTEQMRVYFEEKITSMLGNMAIMVSSVRGIVSVEKGRHEAELIVSAKNHNFEAQAETYDMYEAMDKVVEKVEVQIRKHLDRQQDHHRNGSLKEDELKRVNTAAEEDLAESTM